MRATVVIVGAGVVGASIAFHLARRGLRDILVIDRERAPGLGSTSRATGGFRAQFSTEINIRLSLLSREKLRLFREETGVDSGYDPRGYLFLARTPEELSELAALQRLQIATGLTEVRAVSREEAVELSPAIRPEIIVGGSFCPTDGFIRPLEILKGYVAASERSGVRFQYDTELTGFRTSSSRIEAVQTSSGEVAAGIVVNAAGAWAAEAGRMLGLPLPVRPLRRQVASTADTTVISPSTPMTIFPSDGFHFRERDGRVLLLWPDSFPTGDPYSVRFDEKWLQQIVRLRDERIPLLKNVPIERERCWAGLYEMTPDCHAILGRAPGWDNFWLANGSSGHGVMHAPALGQLLAEAISGVGTAIDIGPLRPERFAENDPNRSDSLL